MLTPSVKNMLVISIGTTLETGVVPTQYIVIISALSITVSLKLVITNCDSNNIMFITIMSFIFFVRRTALVFLYNS